MIRPDNVVKFPDIDLKLGIKSSLPNVKATLALLILIWRVSNKASVLDYCEEDGNGIKLTNHLKTKLYGVLREVCDESKCSLETFDALVVSNQIMRSQLESLIVAFELVWKLSKIRFADTNKPSSAERTGGIRYAKRLYFTINMDLLDLLFQTSPAEYNKVLLKWMGVNLNTDPEYEVSLLKILTVFSEGAVYKLSDGQKDVVFNLSSLYSKLIDAAADVDIDGDEEAKGSLRILKSSLQEKMNPYLSYKNGSVSLAGNGEAIRNYNERVNAYLSLSTSRIMGYRDADEVEPTVISESSEYEVAARIIMNYISESGYKFEISSSEIEELYSEFREKFSPERLKAIPDADLLKAIFYSSDSTNDSLCYWLEFSAKYSKSFGSIAGGSAYKFVLFQRKGEDVWITGSPNRPQELTGEQALLLGKEVRDAIVEGANLIGKFIHANSLGDYEELDTQLGTVLGKYAQLQWIHKYYCIIYPKLFATWHSSDWQSHILLAYGIRPSMKYYARSGQLSMIANRANLSGPAFAYASYDRFGNIKRFCRLGTTDGIGGDSLFPAWRQAGIAGVGWNATGDLSNYQLDGVIVRKAISEKLEELYYPQDARMASRKAGEITNFYNSNQDTIFVAANGEKLLALGDNIGKYYYDESQVFAHCKSTTWHTCFVTDQVLPNKSEGLLTSCYFLENVDNLLFLYNKYYHEMDAEGSVAMNEDTNVVVMRPRLNLLHPLNQIVYGAPGTGKTYSSIEFAMAIIENRPINQALLTMEQRRELMTEYTKRVSEGRVVFTTFHQSYGYEEFVQGIRPDVRAREVNFKKVDGVFKSIADTAKHNPTENYVLIIDEINRGNISKIFGELITLIEEDKRLGELNQLSVVLPMGETFSVPNNLYIIGTMNSADKSISLIDTALRRRFSFVEMAPDATLIENETLRNVLLSLNIYIKKELRSTDLLVGHAYFLGKTIDDLQLIMNNNIIPLLYEYFYDDETKVRKALECLTGTDCVIDSEYSGRIRIKKSEHSRD